MLIVLGVFVLDAVTTESRHDWLDACMESLTLSRSDAGCIEFSLGADPADKSRVLLIEIWESLESMHAHTEEMSRRGGPDISEGIISFDSMRFEVSDVRKIVLPRPFAPTSGKRGWWNGDLTPS